MLFCQIHVLVVLLCDIKKNFWCIFVKNLWLMINLLVIKKAFDVLSDSRAGRDIYCYWKSFSCCFQIHVPIVFRGPNGAAMGVGAQHSQCFAAWYSSCPGLKVAFFVVLLFFLNHWAFSSSSISFLVFFIYFKFWSCMVFILPQPQGIVFFYRFFF